MSSNLPDSLRVIRTAAWMWIFYLASLVVVDLFIYAGGPTLPALLQYHLLNALPAFIFLGLAFSKWLQQENPKIILVMVLLITSAPILVNDLLGVRLPPAPLSNLEGMIIRQLPVLLIALVLVAWHYRLGAMIGYGVGVNLVELVIVFGLNRFDQQGLTAFYFITIVRTVSFIVVGIYINQLITFLRAQQVSLKSANDRLTHYASTLESLTVSRERNRMSRELHDTVVHTLSGLSVQLETAKAYWDVNPDTSRGLLGQALDTTRSGLQETRRALKSLRASPLEDLGLCLALRGLAETAVSRSKLDLELHLPEQDLLLSPDVEQCIFRVAQEALENAVHHANARHLMVSLADHSGEVTLKVRDDGIGFQTDAVVPNGHYGLAGMRERAHLVGGTLNIASRPSEGTTIQLGIARSGR